MEERLVLEKVDYDNNELTVYGNTYKLENTCFQTADRQDPTKLLPEEEEVINKLLLSIQQSEKWKRHMCFLRKKGSIYVKYKGNLLSHGSTPVDENGEMESMEIEGETFNARELLDKF